MKELELFASKILLFGEYSIIRSSKALCMPYPLFFGQLSFPMGQNHASKSHESNAELKNLLQFLKHRKSQGKLPFEFDLTSFEFDLGQGLFFQSSIPMGYGLGSSGALVASLYHQYALNRKDFKGSLKDVIELKHNLSLIEAHFHGTSSGVDPLLSYMNKTLLINSPEHIESVAFPRENMKGDAALFIVNTNRARRTEALVNLFMEKLNTESFRLACDEELSPVTNDCIDYLLNYDPLKFAQSFALLSKWQFNHLKPMIPTLFQDKWEEGLRSEQFYFKLCGAGGGGFLLGYTPNLERSKKFFLDLEIRVLFRA